MRDSYHKNLTPAEHMCRDGKTWVIPSHMLPSFSIRRTPHTEPEPKCLPNGQPSCQWPRTIRFCFLPHILSLLSPQLHFLAFTSLLLPGSCLWKHAIPPLWKRDSGTHRAVGETSAKHLGTWQPLDTNVLEKMFHHQGDYLFIFVLWHSVNKTGQIVLMKMVL